MCSAISSLLHECQGPNLKLHACVAKHFTKVATPLSQVPIFSERRARCHLCLRYLKIDQEMLLCVSDALWLTEDGRYPGGFKPEK